MKSYLPFFTTLYFTLFFGFASYSQEYTHAYEETITVNSVSSITGYTRNKASVTLPEKTVAYVYRITVTPVGSNKKAGVSLLSQLISKTPASAAIGIGINLAEHAIENNDGYSVDAFIFDNTYDADNFYSKKDNNWRACKYMINRNNCCFSTNECIGRNIYFGFRNNNIKQGLNVKLEVVAIIDTTSHAKTNYSFTIYNSVEQELKFYVSSDNINWQESTLKYNYQETFVFPKTQVYFKIYSGNINHVLYTISSGERYKIIWDAINKKYDLIRY